MGSFVITTPKNKFESIDSHDSRSSNIKLKAISPSNKNPFRAREEGKSSRQTSRTRGGPRQDTGHEQNPIYGALNQQRLRSR